MILIRKKNDSSHGCTLQNWQGSIPVVTKYHSTGQLERDQSICFDYFGSAPKLRHEWRSRFESGGALISFTNRRMQTRVSDNPLSPLRIKFEFYPSHLDRPAPGNIRRHGMARCKNMTSYFTVPLPGPKFCRLQLLVNLETKKTTPPPSRYLDNGGDYPFRDFNVQLLTYLLVGCGAPCQAILSANNPIICKLVQLIASLRAHQSTESQPTAARKWMTVAIL